MMAMNDDDDKISISDGNSDDNDVCVKKLSPKYGPICQYRPIHK